MIAEQYNVDPVGGREHWLALRRQDVTASVAGALLGVDPYKSHYRLWMEKSGRHSEDVDETAAMLRGKMLEAPALSMLAIDRPKWKVWQPNVYLRDTTARIGATPDAYAVDPARAGFGVVQVKSVHPRNFKTGWINEDGEAEPPLHVAVQTIQEAHLAGASWAAALALVIDNGIDVHVVPVEIHDGVIARLRDETSQFWKAIENGIEPDPDYARDGSLIAGMYADDNGREIDLSGDNMLPAILAERAEIKARMSAGKARLDAIEAEVVHKIGDHERAFVPGWNIRRPIVDRRGFYVEPTSYRKLSIRELT